MKTRMGIFSIIIILGALFLAGTVTAQAENGNPAAGAAHFTPRPSDDLNAPAPIPGDGNWTRNWTRNLTRDIEWDGECDNLFGPDSPFYGLKLGFEDLDESFTFNETERIEKRIRHGDYRLLEMICELDRNQTRNLERILERYWEKMNQTEDSLGPYASNGTGLLHAREMILKHQWILQNLSEQRPENRGLAKAYNNSQKLQFKFDEKIRARYSVPASGNTTALQDNGDGKPGKGNGNDKVPPGQQKKQDQQQGAGTSGSPSENGGPGNDPKDNGGQKGGGNSQKDKDDVKKNNGNGGNP